MAKYFTISETELYSIEHIYNMLNTRITPPHVTVEVLGQDIEAIKKRADPATRETDKQGGCPYHPYCPDDPLFDTTDGAHPAWWRGHDYTADRIVAMLSYAIGQSQDASLREILDIVREKFKKSVES
jgi:hypothetical protein